MCQSTLRIERNVSLIAGFGTPGLGNGTFAFIGYKDVVPAKAFPKVEIEFPPKQVGDPPVTAHFELKERC